jgi:hypothetical protein
MGTDSRQQKRRIQPEVVSPSQAAANPLFVQATSLTASEPSSHGQTPANLQEQAAFAAANLGPGRRVWVDISEKKDEINYRKVIHLYVNGTLGVAGENRQFVV